MNTGVSNLPPFEPGNPIEGAALAEIIESRHPDFLKGEMKIGRSHLQ
jgi:NADPH-dependent curcumin reductase CurA